MEKYERFLPGKRILKTGIAVFLCVQFFYLFDYYEPINAALACVITMEQTSEKTKIKGINRTYGTLMGGVSSYICLIIMEYFNIMQGSILRPLLVAVFVMFAILIMKVLKAAPYARLLAGIVTAVTLLSHGSSQLDALSYVTIRVVETIIGIIVAYFVNRYILPNEIETT